MTPLRRSALCAALCAGLAIPAAAGAQAWSVGRPDPQPELAAPRPPSYPAAPRRGSAPPAAAQTVTVSPDGAPLDASVTLRPATGQPEGDSTLVEELEIVIRAPGPAMWRVTRGGSEVVILGGYSPLPHALQWDQRRLASNLDGARALLMPPEPKVGVLEGAGLMLRAGAIRLPGFTPLESQLPPPLRAKFQRALATARLPGAKYAKWRPAAAGLWMLGDFRRAVGFSDLKPGTTVERLAKAKGVRIERTGRLGVGAAVGALLSMPQPQQLACLDAASDEVLFESGHMRAAAEAWANGRLHEVKANTSDAVLDRCLLAQAGVRAVLERSTADATRAIDEALAKPGRTVALIDLRLLDRPNGVLDRLKAEGAQVTAPRSAG